MKHPNPFHEWQTLFFFFAARRRAHRDLYPFSRSEKNEEKKTNEKYESLINALNEHKVT